MESTGHYIAKIKEFGRITGDMFVQTNLIMNRYMWFAAKGLAYNFPGGLYGLLGFLFLAGQICALSGKIVLDHLPAECRW